ncbi:MAG TPA: hypothetical protein PKL36_12915, partial [Agitococcus sp.]|nr:hypothetical protein [Agitococcus sp.]
MLKWLAKNMIAIVILAAMGQVHAKNDDIDDLRSQKTNEWYIVKDDQHHNIQTWAKREDGKQIRSFKVRAEIEGTVENVMKVFLDFDNWKRWSWKVRISKLLKKVSATEYYAYITHDSPFGVPDRDVILGLKFEPYSYNHPYVGVNIDAVPDIPLEKGFIRMRAETIRMKIYQKNKDTVVFENEGYVDPGGNEPNWAVNFVQRAAPYAIMVGLKRRVENHLFDEGIIVP